MARWLGKTIVLLSVTAGVMTARGQSGDKVVITVTVVEPVMRNGANMARPWRPRHIYNELLKVYEKKNRERVT